MSTTGSVVSGEYHNPLEPTVKKSPKAKVVAIEDVQVSNNILDLLDKHEMTQEQLADRVGVSYRQIQRTVHEHCKSPSLKLALKIAAVLKEPIDRVFQADFTLRKAS